MSEYMMSNKLSDGKEDRLSEYVPDQMSATPENVSIIHLMWCLPSYKLAYHPIN